MGSDSSKAAANGSALDDFIESAKIGDEKSLTEFIEAGIPPNAPGTNGYNALIAAVLHKQMHIIEKLLGIDSVDINMKIVSDGRNCLMIACQNNCNDIVKTLLDRNAKVNDQDTDSLWTALHFAVYNDNLIAIELLLNHPGINIDLMDCSNQSALHIASVQGHVDAARLLLEKGIDFRLLDNEGNNALSLAETDSVRDTILYFVNNNSHVTTPMSTSAGVGGSSGVSSPINEVTYDEVI